LQIFRKAFFSGKNPLKPHVSDLLPENWSNKCVILISRQLHRKDRFANKDATSRRSPMEEIRRILVVSRSTEDCRFAVQCGLLTARKYGADLYVISLLSNPVDLAAVNAPGLFPSEEYKNYASVLQEAQLELDKIIRQEVKGGLPIKELVRDGVPVVEIEKVVREEQINLIIMLAHEEGRLEHFLFGTDNDAIIRRMPCSILLVKKEPEPVKW
jgi:nucleotide-binding universal stress UspA family protein